MGIMIRSTFDPVSPYYTVLATGQNDVRVQIRADFGQDSQELASISIEPPVYLKIIRSGTTYSSYTSLDGVSWSLISGSTHNVDSLRGSLMAGLAVTSGNENMLQTVTFDSVNLSALIP